MNYRRKNAVLVECAIMIALATVLSLIKIYDAPLGGSITAVSMLPIILVSFRRGVLAGLGSGFVYSLIQLLLGAGVFAYVPTTAGVAGSVLLDYILPFTLLGLAGVFYNREMKGKQLLAGILGGTLMVLVLRFICHLVVGAVVWHELTKAGEWNDYAATVGPWLYSFVYNITYMGPEAVLTLAASAVILKLRNLAI